MSARSRNVNVDGAMAAKEKRKPARRDPEKRRQQNVQAQRRYRERLRERMENLETLAAKAAQSRASETPCQSRASESPPCQSHPPQPENTLSALGVWDARTHVDPSFLIRNTPADAVGPYSVSTVFCGCAISHLEVRTQYHDPSGNKEVNVYNLRPCGAARAADPYANNLRVETICTIAAMTAIATYIGLTTEILCADDLFSPFFRPAAAANGSAPGGGAKDDAVRTVQNIFKTLKPDLRPTREQITIEHHPAIDLLPFPTLRTNLILRRGELDEDQFCQDAATGLVCWGGAGLGQRDRNASVGFVPTGGAPWDGRSWEAKAWFVKKYWNFLGGEDGELVRQSEWWRSMRGEDPLGVELCTLEMGVCS